MSAQQLYGKVILAGAGPGDPELVTLRTVKYLQQAAVVLTDRLVSHEIIAAHANREAEIIYVGKQHKKNASTPQENINELMVAHARRGKLVVRLKGGDVSVFSNILSELDTLIQYRIPYEIVPGITAAMGAAAYAGIPLTAREHAKSIRLLTCYKPAEFSEQYWQELAKTDDTLIFYMSSDTLDTIVDNLVRYRISPDCKLAVIEQATTPVQHVHLSGLYDYDQELRGKKFISPSLVIIGKVVTLHEKYKWLSEQAGREPYFKPVGEVPGLVSAEKQHHHVSRA